MEILLTFKKSEKWLYDAICCHSNKSGFVKDILSDHLKAKKIDPVLPGPTNEKEA